MTRELLQQALDALESDPVALNAINNASALLRTALAAPQPEPVAKFHCYEMAGVGEVMLMPHTGPKLKHGDLLYAAPPAAPAPAVRPDEFVCPYCFDQGAAPAVREPLKDEQIYEMYNEPRSDAEMVAFARAIEQAHGIGGGGK